jgi:hypothetical protein
MTQNNLGVAYAGLPTGDRSGNLQKASPQAPLTGVNRSAQMSIEEDQLNRTFLTIAAWIEEYKLWFHGLRGETTVRVGRSPYRFL